MEFEYPGLTAQSAYHCLPGDEGGEEEATTNVREDNGGVVAKQPRGAVSSIMSWIWPMHRYVSCKDEEAAGAAISHMDDPDDARKLDDAAAGAEGHLGSIVEEVQLAETEERGGDVKNVRVFKVPKAEGWRFVADWVQVGKTEFPGVYRSTKTREADRACVERRLASMMRKASVRNADIARYLPRIAVMVMTPSQAEVDAERWMETEAVKYRHEEARPLRVGWLWGAIVSLWKEDE